MAQLTVQFPAEYRLSLLDLPDDVASMVQSLKAPSIEELERLEHTLRGYRMALGTIRTALDLEGRSSSHMSQGLLLAEGIASSRIVACESVCASWRKLPLEMWDHIFSFYIDGIRTRQNPDQGDVSEERQTKDTDIDMAAMNAPLQLMSVCKAWGEAVASSPSIWAALTIPSVARKTAIGWMPFVDGPTALRVLKRLRLIAKNSVPWELTIAKVAYAPVAGGPIPHDALPVSSIIMEACPPLHRLERLKVIGYPLGESYFRAFVFRSLSSLVSWSTMVQPVIFDGLPQVPGLKKAVLINTIDVSRELHYPLIPWSQLTHLLIGSKLNGEQIMGLLKMCVSLRQACFVIYRIPQSTTSTPPTGMTTLHALEVLDIIGYKSDAMHDYLNLPIATLAMPSLSRMRIGGTYRDGPTISRYIQPLHSLTHLSLVVWRESCYRATHYDISAVLDACPLLVNLIASVHFHEVQVDMPEFLTSMSFDASNPRGCHIQRIALLLNLDAVSDYDLRFSELLGFPEIVAATHKMVSSRRAPNTATPVLLEQFSIRVATPRPKTNPFVKIEGSLRPFVDDGLRLSVETSPRLWQDSIPFPTGRHWDEGVMDFLDGF